VTHVPERRLIAGPTAFALLRLRIRCTTVALAILAITLALNVSGVPQSWLTNTFVAAIGVSAMPVIVLIGRAASRDRAERKSGYTTLQYGDKKLEQRDPYLGRVIRRAGEDYLQRTQFQTILQAAKDEAERIAPKRR
jgi:hypothetical protein